MNLIADMFAQFFGRDPLVEEIKAWPSLASLAPAERDQVARAMAARQRADEAKLAKVAQQ